MRAMLRVAPVCLMLALGSFGCEARTSGAGGTSAASTSSASTSGSTTTAVTGSTTVSSSTGAMDPSVCPTLMDKAACESAGCIYQSGLLFLPGDAGPPVCENGVPTFACTYYELTGMQSYTTWRSDSDAGRTVLVLGVAPAVAGFESCNTGSMDPCSCFGP